MFSANVAHRRPRTTVLPRRRLQEAEGVVLGIVSGAERPEDAANRGGSPAPVAPDGKGLGLTVHLSTVQSARRRAARMAVPEPMRADAQVAPPARIAGDGLVRRFVQIEKAQKHPGRCVHPAGLAYTQLPRESVAIRANSGKHEPLPVAQHGGRSSR